MEAEIIKILQVAGPTALVTAGAAWGAAKQALNGTRERVKVIEDRVTRSEDRDRDVLQRVAGIEAKIDIVLERVSK